MITECETEAAVAQELESLTCELSGGFEQRFELSGEFEVASHASHHSDEALHFAEPKQKTVKTRPVRRPSTTVSLVYAKEFVMHKRSILTNKTPHIPGSKMRAKTLLDQPPPNETKLKPWKQADEFTKLMAAAIPMFWMAKSRGWELKAFTLILSQELNDRLDDRDTTALPYIRDQLTRLIPDAVGAGAEFLYGVEKAPIALADKSSRRRWHIHALIIGPLGFSVPGKTPLRRALQALKGEADSDLMFQTPGEKVERDLRSSAMRWCIYAAKNGLSVQINPELAGAYDLPPGKQTFISASLRREAKRWHTGIMSGLTVPKLIQGSPKGLYELSGVDLLTTR